MIFDSILRTGLTVGDQPGKILTLALDPQWWFAVNGNTTPRTIKAPQWGDIEVPAYSAAVFYNGWLAGLVNPYTEELAVGEAANPQTFDQAVTDWLATKVETLE